VDSPDSILETIARISRRERRLIGPLGDVPDPDEGW
jgi:hypothetical protein